MADPTLELIYQYFSKLKQMSEGKAYGLLAQFSKTYKVPQWMISRIINAEGDHEPRRNRLKNILSGIIDNPLDGVLISAHIKAEELSMAEPQDVDIALKFLAILSRKSQISPATLKSLIDLIDGLYNETRPAKPTLKIIK